jgi:hypothetical protein
MFICPQSLCLRTPPITFAPLIRALVLRSWLQLLDNSPDALMKADGKLQRKALEIELHSH